MCICSAIGFRVSQVLVTLPPTNRQKTTFFSAISGGNCDRIMPFVCQTQPLDVKPDNPCPNGFVPYKDKCLEAVAISSNYTDAQV